MNIWMLLTKGLVTTEDIVKALRLLQQLPWSTNTTEEQHASASVIARLHPEYDAETVRIRAFVHCFLKILPAKGDEDKHIEKEREQLGCLMRLNPNYLTGRQFYCGQLVGLTKGRNTTPQGRPFPNMVQHVVMKRHGIRWRELTDEQRHHWEQKAAEARALRWKKLEDDRDQSESMLQFRRQQKSAEDAKFGGYTPMGYNACRLEEDELDILESIMSQPQMHGEALKLYRDKSRMTPIPSTKIECPSCHAIP